MKLIIFLLSLCLTTTTFAQDIKQIVSENLGRQPGAYPRVPTPDYTPLHKAAIEGDQDAQEKLFSIIADHFEAVYASVEKNDSVLFSLRKIKKGMYDYPSSNYAINIETLLERTADQMTVNKRGIKISTLDGEEKLIDRIKYADKDKTITIKCGEKEFAQIPLASLIENDRQFITSALIDDAFDSDLEISCEDSDEEESEQSSGGNAPLITTTESITRHIILENEGDFPIHNLLIEYQSFLEQSLVDYSEDLPEDYALVGYSRIDSIEPGNQVKIKVPVPAVLQERYTGSESGDYTYFHESPPGTHTSSEGDIKGLWVKVHRITPYGEHLEISKKFKTGSKKWKNVAPLSIKID